MSDPKNAMEIFKHLDKSNCRKCGEKTCLAFAGAVYQARKKINQCPHLEMEIIKKYSSNKLGNNSSIDLMGSKFIHDLKQSLPSVDFMETSDRCGGKYDGKTLTVKVLGKDFGVRTDGTFSTDIHVNTWITGPVLDYLILGKGKDPSGEWISFREIKGSDDLQYSFFKRRCEEGMKKIADYYTDLFDDLVHIFGGNRVEKQFLANISVVLFPLPKVPLMICYMESEDGMPSTLNLYFDQSIDANLGIDSVLTLCAGFSMMIEKLTEKHGRIFIPGHEN
jgi:hypothetical protein